MWNTFTIQNSLTKVRLIIGDAGKILFFFFKSYCSIVDLLCCVLLLHSKVSQLHKYVLFHILFHYDLSQDIEL